MENKRMQEKMDKYIEAFEDYINGNMQNKHKTVNDDILSNYEMRVFPKKTDDGTTYWTATFLSIPGCIGGGDTPEEAVKEAMENLMVYMELLEE